MASKAARRELAPSATATAEAEGFARIFAHAGSAIGKLAPDGRFLLVNQAFCELTGYGRDDLIAGAFQQITHPDDLAADLEALEALLAGEAERYSRDKRYVRRNSREIWVRVTVSLVRDARGEPDFFIKVAQNIDAQKIAEQVLAAREAQLRTIVETVPAALVVAELPSADRRRNSYFGIAAPARLDPDCDIGSKSRRRHPVRARNRLRNVRAARRIRRCRR